MRVYRYVDSRGIDHIEVWVTSLDSQSRAKFRNKTDMLRRADADTLPGLVRGFNIQGQAHIGKLAIGSSGRGRALRPLICRGPIEVDVEITILIGAEEIGGDLPKGIAQIAEARRLDIISNPSTRRRLYGSEE